MIDISEEEYQDMIIELAHKTGWIVAHFRSVQKKDGSWETPVQADGKGFPDLVLVRERVIYAELKSEKGEPTPEQRFWLQLLAAASEEVYLWKPSEFEDVKAVLTTRRERSTKEAK